MNIDPLSPYLPLALLVATVVALLLGLLSTTVDGKTVSKLDGKAVVLPIVAFFSIGVVAWSQLHTGVVWSKVAMDAPIVFILAAGGATFLQRLKDRGSLMLTGEVADMKASPAVLTPEDAKALSDAVSLLSAMGKKPDTVRTYEVGISAVLDRNTAAAIAPPVAVSPPSTGPIAP